MSSKILTSYIASINDFVSEPQNIINNAKNGIVAIFAKNEPIFYAISKQRLEKLLELEKDFINNQLNNLKLSNSFYKKENNNSVNIPIGKFAMHSEWQPDLDFLKLAALWGIYIDYPITSEELTAFISYWKVENKVLHHVQWQQKLARSVNISRSINNKKLENNNNNINKEFDNLIPPGFRG